jgi:VWFA-related protein
VLRVRQVVDALRVPTLVLVAVLSASVAPDARQTFQRRPSFRTGVELIYVNVVVRDKDGNVVRGLSKDDFALVEDDKTQTITTFDFEEVPSEALPVEQPAPLTAPILQTPPAVKAEAGAAPAARPAEPIDLRNHRLIVLLFDSSSMQPEELERAITSAREYIDTRLTAADLVAIASVSSALEIVQDFTANRETLSKALDSFSGVDTAGFEAGGTPTGEETEVEGFVADDSEFNIFNTDRRLEAIERLSESLAPVQQKKSIVSFSSGMSRSGEDN